jgi:hypothetical protein
VFGKLEMPQTSDRVVVILHQLAHVMARGFGKAFRACKVGGRQSTQERLLIIGYRATSENCVRVAH